ncbi:MAG: hypothetical protein C4346_17540, partial [Chloroflexota bacterium]
MIASHPCRCVPSPRLPSERASRIDWRSDLLLLMLTAAEATVIWLALDILARLGQRSTMPV